MTLQHTRVALLGTGMGLTLSLVGFSDWGEVHHMFTFADLRLTLVFALTVVLSGLGFRLICGPGCFARQPLHKGIVPGSILFGAGWALTGACPSIGLVQLGEGRLPALISLAGVLVGTFAYRKVHARFFGWERGGCGI